ncbi:MAG: FHA domain-containing protein [Planctomycetota bacterium]|nr:FHA domain-containing protein [Planctomycetota bacterium]
MKFTLRILNGADQGRIFDELDPPITIGREEGNTIQLNDERVSRFHVKIQEDADKLILTDLESTNGTKVNGDEIRLRILRYGDLIHLGRTLLLFGSEEQIAKRLNELRGAEMLSDVTLAPEELSGSQPVPSLDFELNWASDPSYQATLHSLQTPELPEGLSPGQAAQLSEIIEYLHLRIRDLILSVKPVTGDEASVTLDQHRWQNLLDLQARLSDYLRRIAEPPELQ